MLSLSESVSLWVPCLQEQRCCLVSSFGDVIPLLCLVFLIRCALQVTNLSWGRFGVFDLLFSGVNAVCQEPSQLSCSWCGSHSGWFLSRFPAAGALLWG